jgi:hypothetical protein
VDRWLTHNSLPQNGFEVEPMAGIEPRSGNSERNLPLLLRLVNHQAGSTQEPGGHKAFVHSFVHNWFLRIAPSEPRVGIERRTLPIRLQLTQFIRERARLISLGFKHFYSYLFSASIVGGLYAAGLSPEEMDRMLTSTVWNDLFTDRLVGPLYLAYGHAESGHQAFYFYLGRGF